MRTIDADELLKRVDEEREYLKARGQLGAEHILVHNFRDLIDNAPTVEQEVYITGEDYDLYMRGYKQARKDYERPQGEWIPVSERLPEEKLFNPSGSDFGFDFEEVLCTTIWGDVRSYKYGKPIGHDKPHFWLGGGIMDEYVIAWQYKPEPYRVEMRGDEE